MPIARKEVMRRYRNRLREETVWQYGGTCSCGECDINKLELHHPGGDGNRDRAEKIGRGLRSCGGWNFYLKLKKLGWPPGYEVKCIDCHDKIHGRLPASRRQHCPPGIDTGRDDFKRVEEDVIPF